MVMSLMPSHHTSTVVRMDEAPTSPTTDPAQVAAALMSSSSSPTGGSPAAEEGLLRDVLDELDRERSRRAEAEARLRQAVEETNAVQAALQAERETARGLQEQLEQHIGHIQKLDKEIAQYQQKIREHRAGPPPPPPPPPVTASQHEFLVMETQMLEYRSLVEELTYGKPAIQAALAAENATTTIPTATTTTPSSSTTNSLLMRANPSLKQSSNPSSMSMQPHLPVHAVRLLEIMPWTPHALEHVFGQEVLYEWQSYDLREKRWTSQLKVLPPVFKKLPVKAPKAGPDASNQNSKDRSLLVFLAGGHTTGTASGKAPSKYGVLTDEGMAYILDMDDGYPLPADGGTWEWCGGWRVDKRDLVENHYSNTKHKVDCDESGWSYALYAEDFLTNPSELVWDNPGTTLAATSGIVEAPGAQTFAKETAFAPLRTLRRRKWTRQRVLTDYPHASERSRQYLKLLAENSRLNVTNKKMCDQLVDLKTELTSHEENIMRVKDETSAEIAVLREQLQHKEELLRNAPPPAIGDGSTTATASPKTRLKNKLSAWVKTGRKYSDEFTNRKNSDDLSSNKRLDLGEESTVATTATTDDDTLSCQRNPNSETAPNSEPGTTTTSSSTNNTTTSSSSSSSTSSSSLGSATSTIRSTFDWKKVTTRSNFFDKLKTDRATRILEKLGEAAKGLKKDEGSVTDESLEEANDVVTTATDVLG